jgi:penicillin-insensitive murein endopeptidase
MIATGVCGLGNSCRLLSFLALTMFSSWANAESTCYGTPNKGYIDESIQLPDHGSNFSAYSTFGVSFGRTYVHTSVRDIIVDAYGVLASTAPDKVFVYGETGWKSGGRLRPHRTHQNGLSVDFFVPVTNSKGESVPLPISPLNKFGYGINFDANGQFENLKIDFEAIGEHLYQLSLAAKKSGASIALVIFDPPYLPKLLKTKRGEFLRQNINFMKGSAWVRHDEHYHVDFAVPCKPFSE